jgi:DNA polymerase V
MKNQLFRQLNYFEIVLIKLVIEAGQNAPIVHAAFPSPAEEYKEKKLDLNEHLIQKPSATFFVKAHGNALNGEAIFHQDLLIVDRSLKPKPGSIVIAQLDGFLHVKKLLKEFDRFYLASGSDKQDITNDETVVIWGVVIHAIHHFVSIL